MISKPRSAWRGYDQLLIVTEYFSVKHPATQQALPQIYLRFDLL